MESTIPAPQYDIMKDQLKETFSDASNHVSMKNEDVFKTEVASVVEDFSQMKIQHKYSPDKVIVQQN